jgi:hypothetical protein
MPRHPSGPPTTWCRRRRAARRRRRNSPFSQFGLPRYLYGDGPNMLWDEKRIFKLNNCFVSFWLSRLCLSSLCFFNYVLRKKMTHHNPLPLKSLHIIFKLQFDFISIFIGWVPFVSRFIVLVDWGECLTLKSKNTLKNEIIWLGYLSAQKIQVCLQKKNSPVFINQDSLPFLHLGFQPH